VEEVEELEEVEEVVVLLSYYNVNIVK